MNKPVRIGVVGLGKISKDQHLPVISSSPEFELVFVVDRAVKIDAPIPWYGSLSDALNDGVAFDAVSICTSPQVRHELIELLFASQCALLLEKPAASSYALAAKTTRLAVEHNLTMFAAWHARFAPQISAAKKWVAAHELAGGHIEWRENHQKWHPGQDWLWREGGYGVFDPGINALSILTEVTSNHWLATEATLWIPKNVETSSRAEFSLSSTDCSLTGCFEFHERDDETWTIQLKARNGSTLTLLDGGARMQIDGIQIANDSVVGEYERVYGHFSSLCRNQQTDCDLSPLKLAGDIQKIARRVTIDPIHLE